MIAVELLGQISCWYLNLEELFNTNAKFGKMLNFEQRITIDSNQYIVMIRVLQFIQIEVVRTQKFGVQTHLE